MNYIEKGPWESNRTELGEASGLVALFSHVAENTLFDLKPFALDIVHDMLCMLQLKLLYGRWS